MTSEELIDRLEQVARDYDEFNPEPDWDDHDALAEGIVPAAYF